MPWGIDRSISITIIFAVLLQSLVGLKTFNEMGFNITANAESITETKVSVVSLREDLKTTDEKIHQMNLQSERIKTQLEYIVMTLDRVDKKLEKN